MTTEPLLLKNLVGESLEGIWKAYEGQDFCKHRFMAPHRLHPGALLFVGINPSYKQEDENTQYYGYHEGSLPYFRSMKRIAEAVEKQLLDGVTMPAWAHVVGCYQACGGRSRQHGSPHAART